MKKMSMFLLLLLAGIVCATSQNVSEIESMMASSGKEVSTAWSNMLLVMAIIAFGLGILLAIAWVVTLKRYAAEYMKKDKEIKGTLDAFIKFSLALRLGLVLLAIVILALFFMSIVFWLFSSVFKGLWDTMSRFNPALGT